MHRLTLLLVGLGLTLATSAQAAFQWQNPCQADAITGVPAKSTTLPAQSNVINTNGRGCLVVEDADSTGYFGPVIVKSATGFFSVDTDVTSSTPGGGEFKIRRCPGGQVPTTDANIPKVCYDMGGAKAGETVLDGTEGQDGVQNNAIPVTNGVFVIEVVTACDTDACVVYIEGELPQ
jgi:hypothetical protein